MNLNAYHKYALKRHAELFPDVHSQAKYIKYEAGLEPLADLEDKYLFFPRDWSKLNESEHYVKNSKRMASVANRYGVNLNTEGRDVAYTTLHEFGHFDDNMRSGRLQGSSQDDIFSSIMKSHYKLDATDPRSIESEWMEKYGARSKHLKRGADSPLVRAYRMSRDNARTATYRMRTEERHADKYAAEAYKKIFPRPLSYLSQAEKKIGNIKKLDVRFDKGNAVGSFLSDKEYLAEGSESTVFRKGSKVFKVSEPYADKSVGTYNARVDQRMMIDKLIGDGSTEHIGFYEQNGVRNPVFSQNFIGGRSASKDEIAGHMSSRGFALEKEGKYGDSFTKTLGDKIFKIMDLDTDNVKIGPGGSVHVIDAALVEKQISSTRVGNAGAHIENAVAKATEASVKKGLATTSKVVKSFIK